MSDYKDSGHLEVTVRKARGKSWVILSAFNTRVSQVSGVHKVMAATVLSNYNNSMRISEVSFSRQVHIKCLRNCAIWQRVVVVRVNSEQL